VVATDLFLTESIARIPREIVELFVYGTSVKDVWMVDDEAEPPSRPGTLRADPHEVGRSRDLARFEWRRRVLEARFPRCERAKAKPQLLTKRTWNLSSQARRKAVEHVPERCAGVHVVTLARKVHAHKPDHKRDSLRYVRYCPSADPNNLD
jgi:hypothetical protein